MEERPFRAASRSPSDGLKRLREKSFCGIPENTVGTAVEERRFSAAPNRLPLRGF